jgi:hypothetical protein
MQRHAARRQACPGATHVVPNGRRTSAEGAVIRCNTARGHHQQIAMVCPGRRSCACLPSLCNAVILCNNHTRLLRLRHDPVCSSFILLSALCCIRLPSETWQRRSHFTFRGETQYSCNLPRVRSPPQIILVDMSHGDRGWVYYLPDKGLQGALPRANVLNPDPATMSHPRLVVPPFASAHTAPMPIARQCHLAPNISHSVDAR